MVNALLEVKRKEAARQGTSLLYVPSGLCPQFPCEEFELIEIIGNLLNNALEAVDTLEESERKVIFRMETTESGIFIEARNPFPSVETVPAKQLSHKGYSTKKWGQTWVWTVSRPQNCRKIPWLSDFDSGRRGVCGTGAISVAPQGSGVLLDGTMIGLQ